MKRTLQKLGFLASLLLIAVTTYGQMDVTGKVVDADNKESLPGALIQVKGSTLSTLSSFDGTFTLSGVQANATLVISFIGYQTAEFAAKTDMGTITLESDAVGIGQVEILANVAVDRKTPVAVSSIKPSLIEEKLGTQEYPEVLKSTPSVYATKQGGGYGDARINVRGFDARNVAVMINGVPVNDMENGWVYWSNWAGLADATRSIQVQRGLGASKIAVPSIGGTINILTKTTDIEKGGNVFYGIGNDAYAKKGFTVSTGLTDGGWAFTASASMTTGDGYVDGTEFEAYSYYANVSKKIKENHRLSLSLVGAPQWHGQRSSSMKIADYQSSPSGIKYSKDWGYRNGEVEFVRKNFYHKPQAILNHFWDISSKTDLSTAVYASIGTGGGTGPYGSEQSKFYNYFTDGQVDFDRIVAENEANGDLGSTAILRASVNNHYWYGVLSNLTHDLENGLVLSGGIDLRYYKGEHYREVVDLLGGSMIIDDSDMNNPNKVARVGDIIDYYNDGLVGWGGAFAQAEYSLENLTVFAAGSFSSISNKRIDYFQYVPAEQETDWASFLAYSAKGGANYNLTDNHNVFLNAGYFERQPDFDAVYVNYGNNLNPDAENEKIMSFEFGYGLRANGFNANINVYNTEWKDKTFTPSFRQPDGEYYTANMLGVDALHQGVEFDFVLTPAKDLTITGMASYANWKWKNNLENVSVTDESQNEVGIVDLYIKDVPVGDAAQTTAALGINYKFFNALKIGADYNYYDRLFARFDPTSSAFSAPLEDGTNVQPWQLPAYQLIDLNVRYSFKLGNMDASLLGKVNNLLDVEYISDGFDGSNHDWSTANVYYGYGRTWSMMLKIRF